ncbi:MAG: penicillin-binding protein 1A [Vibrio sp.]
MKFITRLFILILVCIILGVGVILGFYSYLKPQLPDVAALRNIELQTPMQVFSQDGKLIAQFGEKKRIPLTLDEIPPKLIQAVIATEDSRFYEHHGVDPVGITRAALVVAMSGSAKQGASTITQQLARNFFLNNDKKLIRKIKEVFIAIHIEELLTKDEILELYLNKIYLGHRSYGVGAAAHVYFGKDIQDLTLGEIAIIAGLPKAPSTMNPIYSVDRARTRRDVVLSRMLVENYITKEEYEAAKAEPIISKYHGAKIELNAPYVAEMARSWAKKKYGDLAYTSGLRIYTSVKSDLQNAASEAAIGNLLNYDERHGYRGPQAVAWKADETPFTEDQMKDYLRKQPTYGLLFPAIVTQVDGKSAQVYIKNIGQKTIEWDGMKWARRFRTDESQGPAPKRAADVLATGQQVWVRQMDDLHEVITEETENEITDPEVQEAVWRLSQVPDANTAFVAMNPNNGSVVSLVGGFNFNHSKFNRVTMSVRQVGSAIKPFIYSAAIDKGLTLATLINDAPISKWDPWKKTTWRPKNSPPTYLGPTRMRIGLAQSKNVMAIRVLRRVGLKNVIDYLPRFGFDRSKIPNSETIALGAGSLTPLKMAQGLSVFANGGYHIEPYFIDHVEDPYGNLVYRANPTLVCEEDCPTDPITVDAQGTQQMPRKAHEVISQQTAFLVRQMMYSNIWGGGSWKDGTAWNGTGWRGKELKRHDIGGKTGTTNDVKDAWYNGYGPNIVATVWVGFDKSSRGLGRTRPSPYYTREQQYSGGESGATTSQPAWINFMKVALKDVPEQELVLPPDIEKMRINRNTGNLTKSTGKSSVWEYFLKGTEPKMYTAPKPKKRSNEAVFTSDGGDDSLF